MDHPSVLKDSKESKKAKSKRFSISTNLTNDVLTANRQFPSSILIANHSDIQGDIRNPNSFSSSSPLSSNINNNNNNNNNLSPLTPTLNNFNPNERATSIHSRISSLSNYSGISPQSQIFSNSSTSHSHSLSFSSSNTHSPVNLNSNNKYDFRDSIITRDVNSANSKLETNLDTNNGLLNTPTISITNDDIKKNNTNNNDTVSGLIKPINSAAILSLADALGDDFVDYIDSDNDDNYDNNDHNDNDGIYINNIKIKPTGLENENLNSLLNNNNNNNNNNDNNNNDNDNIHTNDDEEEEEDDEEEEEEEEEYEDDDLSVPVLDNVDPIAFIHNSNDYNAMTVAAALSAHSNTNSSLHTRKISDLSNITSTSSIPNSSYISPNNPLSILSSSSIPYLTRGTSAATSTGTSSSESNTALRNSFISITNLTPKPDSNNIIPNNQNNNSNTLISNVSSISTSSILNMDNNNMDNNNNTKVSKKHERRSSIAGSMKLGIMPNKNISMDNNEINNNNNNNATINTGRTSSTVPTPAVVITTDELDEENNYINRFPDTVVDDNIIDGFFSIPIKSKNESNNNNNNYNDDNNNNNNYNKFSESQTILDVLLPPIVLEERFVEHVKSSSKSNSPTLNRQSIQFNNTNDINNNNEVFKTINDTIIQNNNNLILNDIDINSNKDKEIQLITNDIEVIEGDTKIKSNKPKKKKRKKDIRLAQAVHYPGLGDEIMINVGDMLEIVGMYTDGWILGRNLSTMHTGVFPCGCIGKELEEIKNQILVQQKRQQQKQIQIQQLIQQQILIENQRQQELQNLNKNNEELENNIINDQSQYLQVNSKLLNNNSHQRYPSIAESIPILSWENTGIFKDNTVLLKPQVQGKVSKKNNSKFNNESDKKKLPGAKGLSRKIQVKKRVNKSHSNLGSRNFDEEDFDEDNNDIDDGDDDKNKEINNNYNDNKLNNIRSQHVIINIDKNNKNNNEIINDIDDINHNNNNNNKNDIFKRKTLKTLFGINKNKYISSEDLYNQNGNNNNNNNNAINTINNNSLDINNSKSAGATPNGSKYNTATTATVGNFFATLFGAKDSKDNINSDDKLNNKKSKNKLNHDDRKNSINNNNNNNNNNKNSFNENKNENNDDHKLNRRYSWQSSNPSIKFGLSNEMINNNESYAMNKINVSNNSIIGGFGSDALIYNMDYNFNGLPKGKRHIGINHKNKANSYSSGITNKSQSLQSSPRSPTLSPQSPLSPKVSPIHRKNYSLGSPTDVQNMYRTEIRRQPVINIKGTYSGDNDNNNNNELLKNKVNITEKQQNQTILGNKYGHVSKDSKDRFLQFKIDNSNFEEENENEEESNEINKNDGNVDVDVDGDSKNKETNSSTYDHIENIKLTVKINDYEKENVNVNVNINENEDNHQENDINNLTIPRIKLNFQDGQDISLYGSDLNEGEEDEEEDEDDDELTDHERRLKQQKIFQKAQQERQQAYYLYQSGALKGPINPNLVDTYGYMQPLFLGNHFRQTRKEVEKLEGFKKFLVDIKFFIKANMPTKTQIRRSITISVLMFLAIAFILGFGLGFGTVYQPDQHVGTSS